MRIRFNKIDGFLISLDDKIKHLILFDYGLLDKICDMIKYLISEKSGITKSINHNFGKIKIYSYNSLPIKKILTFHIIILIKSVFNKNENKYYYNIFLGKGSYKCKSYKKYIYVDICILWMIYYDMIDVFEGIDDDKATASKECDVCHYWYFLNYTFVSSKRL